jgi:hypothetical protein
MKPLPENAQVRARRFPMLQPSALWQPKSHQQGAQAARGCFESAFSQNAKKTHAQAAGRNYRLPCAPLFR